MRRHLAAFVVVALTAAAAPSRAAFTTHFDTMTADVDARLAALTGTLTKPQKLDKSHLSALSKALHKKSTTLTMDLKIAVSASKLVAKNFHDDATLPAEIVAALAGFYADVLAVRNAVATSAGQPVKNACAILIADLAKADGHLDDYENNVENAVELAGYPVMSDDLAKADANVGWYHPIDRVCSPGVHYTSTSLHILNLEDSGGPLNDRHIDCGISNSSDDPETISVGVTLDNSWFQEDATTVVVPAKVGTHDGFLFIGREGDVGKAGKHTADLVINGELAAELVFTAKNP